MTAEPADVRRPGLDARSLIRSASWMSGAHALAQLLAYASLLVLARLLPPGSFGVVAAGTAVLYIAVELMDAGTQGTIVVRREQVSRAFVRRAVVRCVAVGILLAAVIALASGAFARTFTRPQDDTVMAVIGLGVPFFALAVVPLALLQRSLQFRDIARAWAAANVLSAAAAVIAGALGAGVWSLVTRQLLLCATLAALASAFAYSKLPRLLAPRPRRAADDPRAGSGARWFLAFGVTQIITLNLDYLVVGNLETVRALGLYSLAFMIAFAPAEHFSSQVGKVLLAAAAADTETSGARTVGATRLMTLLLAPLVPVAIVLAPPVIPALLGSDWTGMVAPFQLLIAAGVGYAIVNCIGESLSGGGSMDFRAKVNAAWCVATLVALILLVGADAIRGAGIAHVVIFIGYAATYVVAGTRRIGTDPATLGRALAPVLIAVALQGAVTAGVAFGLDDAGASSGLAAGVAAVTGLAAMTALATLGRRAPMREAITVLRAAAARGAGS